MDEGILLRIMEIKKLENAVTKVNAIHMTKAFATLVVTASAEQIPKICSAIGLLLKIGVVKILLVSAMIILLHPYLLDQPLGCPKMAYNHLRQSSTEVDY